MEKFIFEIVYPAIFLIPGITGIIYYRYLGRAEKAILYYVLYSGIENIADALMVRYLHTKSYIPFHVSSIVWFAGISGFYAEKFKGRTAKIIWGVVAIYAILTIINLLYIQKTDRFNTYTSTLEAILVLVWGMIYLNRESFTETESKWGDNSTNWINTGLLLYHSVCLVMYVFLNYIADPAIGFYMWHAHNAALLTMYILFAVGFNKCRKAKTY